MPKVRAKSKGFGQWCREDAESFQESIGEYCIEERQAAKSDVEEGIGAEPEGAGD